MKQLTSARKYLLRRVQYLGLVLLNAGFTPLKATVLLFFSLVAFWVLLATYNALSSAAKNYELLGKEQRKLEYVKQQNQKLQQDLDYYSSIEYKQRYARDSLNLAKPGEDLYMLDEERLKVDLPQDNPDPIIHEEAVWWSVLFSVLFKS